MSVNIETYQSLKAELEKQYVQLVAVSKMKPASAVQALYDLGQRDFGENYVQELVDKAEQLPADIRWHFIGHLQTNKVKFIAPFVHLIQGVDSLKLLKEINKQAAKNNRTISVLLQMHIAQEETKFGMDEAELVEALNAAAELSNVQVVGLMGMASFSDNQEQVRKEFRQLKDYYDQYAMYSPYVLFTLLSMGMSNDYALAIEEGANIVRIGSLLFGRREKKN